MAEILKERTFVSSDIGLGYGVEIAVDFQFVPGEEYTICFDGSEYTCTAHDASGLVPGYVVVGNASEYGFPSNNEPFGIVGDSTAGVIAVVCRNDSAPAEHSVSISTAEDKDYLIKGSTLKGIANAIRNKIGATGDIAVTDMAAKISEITGGGGSGADVVYVTFLNHDGSGERFVRPVVPGNTCVEPVGAGLMATPTRESTAEHNFTFSGGWATTPNGGADANALKNVTEDRTVYAAYVSTVRFYTVRFFDGDTQIGTDQSVAYGGNATPPIVENKDDLIFDSWNPSYENITGDTDCHVVWSEIVTFAGGSWEKIIEIANNGQATQYFAVGDEKTEVITYADGTTEEITWVVADFGKGKCKDGSKGNMIIVAKHALATKKQAHNTDVFSYYIYSDIGKYLINDFYNALDASLQSGIKPVDINGSRYDTCWLLCPSQLNLTPGNFGVTYDYGVTDALALFSTQASRVRTLGKSGSAVDWWLRSSKKTGTVNYQDRLNWAYVKADGSPSSTVEVPIVSKGIVPAFCI